MQATAIILAAGLGTRMKSTLPKTLHPLAGRPILRHLLESCKLIFDHIVVVLGPGMDAVRQITAPHSCVVQQEPRGTAHAALQAIGEFGSGQVAVLYADNPLIRPTTLRRLLDQSRQEHSGRGHGLSLLAFCPPDPGRYGRVIVGDDGLVWRIVEYADATATERAINLCNAGVLCASAEDMARWLRSVRNDNAKAEFYLGDVVALARADGVSVTAVEAPADELAGINSRAELAQAEAVLQGWLRRSALDAGVTMIDPSSVFLSADTRLSCDVTIEPNVFFGPGVSVASNVLIRAFSHLEGAHIGAGSIIGPFARLRPGAHLESDVHVGNFVEIKASTLGARGQGQPPELYRRRDRRHRNECRRRHDHLQLRRHQQTSYDDRRACLRRLRRCPGGAGHCRRRRGHRRRKRDHRGCRIGRAGAGTRTTGAKAGTGQADADSHARGKTLMCGIVGVSARVPPRRCCWMRCAGWNIAATTAPASPPW